MFCLNHNQRFNPFLLIYTSQLALLHFTNSSMLLLSYWQFSHIASLTKLFNPVTRVYDGCTAFEVKVLGKYKFVIKIIDMYVAHLSAETINTARVNVIIVCTLQQWSKNTPLFSLILTTKKNTTITKQLVNWQLTQNYILFVVLIAVEIWNGLPLICPLFILNYRGKPSISAIIRVLAAFENWAGIIPPRLAMH